MNKLLLCILILPNLAWAIEKSDSFDILISNDKVRVVSPTRKSKTIAVIVKNDTLTNIFGKLTSKDKDLEFFKIKSLSTKTLELDYSKIKKLYYVSISPPFQAIELKFSEKPYEIPPKE